MKINAKEYKTEEFSEIQIGVQGKIKHIAAASGKVWAIVQKQFETMRDSIQKFVIVRYDTGELKKKEDIVVPAGEGSQVTARDIM